MASMLLVPASLQFPAAGLQSNRYTAGGAQEHKKPVVKTPYQAFAPAALSSLTTLGESTLESNLQLPFSVRETGTKAP